MLKGLLDSEARSFRAESIHHVTEKSSAHAIAAEGFCGSWGDAGFGVYFFSSFLPAKEYASRGGWDGELTNPCVLEVMDETIEKVIPDPSWQEDYSDVYWKELDPDMHDTEDARWKPQSVLILPDNALSDIGFS